MRYSNKNIICKHGDNCRYLANGHCHFYHPSQENSIQRGRQNFKASNDHQFRKSLSKGQKSSYFSQNGQNYKSFVPLAVKGIEPYQNKSHQDHSRYFCKSFHFGFPCKFGEKCEKKHDFACQKGITIRRLMQRRDIPNNKIARLTKIDEIEGEILTMRIENQLFCFRYDFENNSVDGIGDQILLPKVNSTIQYFEQRGMYVYFSSENKTTNLTDFGFQNIANLQYTYIQNSHNGKISGIRHYNENLLISSSIDGQIKLWDYRSNELVINIELTQKFIADYNPNGKQLQILFLNIENIDDQLLIVGGTNDGRILFWNGGKYQYFEIVLKDNYTRVFKVKLINMNDILIGLVLVWNPDGSSSALLMINLVSGEIVNIHVVRSQNIGKNLCIFEYMNGYVLIGDFNGEIIIFNLRQGNKKIGVIINQNTVMDIICSTAIVRSTNLTINLIYILQKMTVQRQGSFSIYLLQ